VFDVFIRKQANSRHNQTAGGQKNPVPIELFLRIDASANIFSNTRQWRRLLPWGTMEQAEKYHQIRL
jgi:hypothetical protein